jgi:hypothetical protein
MKTKTNLKNAAVDADVITMRKNMTVTVMMKVVDADAIVMKKVMNVMMTVIVVVKMAMSVVVTTITKTKNKILRIRVIKNNSFFTPFFNML